MLAQLSSLTPSDLRRSKLFHVLGFACLASLLPVGSLIADEPVKRQTWDLTEWLGMMWHVRAEQDSQWIQIGTAKQPFPKSNEAVLADDGVSFDGVAVYRLRIEPTAAYLPAKDTGRWRLRFDAVATETQVTWVEGDKRVELGSHLGGWTPFSMDLTRVIHECKSRPWTIEIRVDERVGHDTQGFLPIVAPHFGGIWQNVFLEHLPEEGLLTESLEVVPTGTLDAPQFRVQVEGLGNALEQAVLRAELRAVGSEPNSQPLAESELAVEFTESGYQAQGQLQPTQIQPWSPSSPQRYEVRVSLVERQTSRVIDSVARTTGWRTVETQGRKLLLNGLPLQVRGVLNWGYDPAALGPTTSEEQMRAELELCRNWGFNLMKFCLWMPPRRYLELADEYGILVWMEYPTWHPRMDETTREQLLKEYREFYRFDGAHPSIVLRSLTCETGHGADESVLRALYDLAKERIPGAIVEDDSSWIEWHRIHDFYDDHPYGNNHTWPATLERLENHIAARTPMPLMLGEAIAADTWLKPSTIGVTQPPQPAADPAATDAAAPMESEPRVLRHPGFARANVAFERDVATRYGAEAASRLRQDSLRYGLLMRKYQIETYRRMQPDSGYVVSVIRDFPLAGMGLIDYADQPKWNAEDWKFQSDTMLLLEIENDARSVLAPEEGSPAKHVPLSIRVAHHGAEPLENTSLRLSWDGKIVATEDVARLEPAESLTIPFELPVEAVSKATRRTLSVQLANRDQANAKVISQNSWDLWCLPPVMPRASIERHSSWNLALESSPRAQERANDGQTQASAVILSRKLDRQLLERLEQGAQVLLVPSGEQGSFTLRSHWFLRGAPIVSTRTGQLQVPRDFWIDLQHFDLAGDVIPDWTELDAITPLVSLWDNHDIKIVKTHPLLFEMHVGQGRLVVAALNLDGPGAAGPWLLSKLIDWTARADRATETQQAQATKNAERLRRELFQREVRLDDIAWRFKVDAEKAGFDGSWFASDLDDSSWETLRIDAHWDGQGHASLDGWAWYRRQVTIPEDWDSATTYLSFTGVDDHYRVFVDGHEVGQGGVIETKQTAFEERASHEISHLIKPGQTITIAVAVYDWYGAGGIFRPVSLTATPISTATPWLR